MPLRKGNSRSRVIAYLGFAGAILILITLGFDVIIYRNMNELLRIDQEQVNSYRTVELLRRMEANLNIALVSHRDFILTGKEEYLQFFLKNQPAIWKDFQELRQLLEARISGNRYELDRLETLIEKKFEALEVMVEIRNKKGITAEIQAVLQNPAQLFLKDIQQIFAEITDAEHGILMNTLKKSETASQQSFFTVILGNITAFILSFGSIFLLNQQIKRRIHVEKALRMERDRLETVTHNIGAGLLVISKSFTILWTNNVMKQMFGNIEGKAYDEIFSQHNKDRGERIFQGPVSDDKANVISEEELVDVYQHRNWFQTIMTPLTDEQNHPVALLELYVPITERKQMEESLKQAKEAAESANHAKSEFLANMSHELRTPLNGILGYTQILQRDAALSEKHRHAIAVIHRSGEHLLTLINDILDLSKIEAGKIELERAEFDLASSLKTIVEMIRIRAVQKGIRFLYEEEPDIPRIVYGDGKRLRQILLNLLSNAVKFTQQGKVVLRVNTLKEQETSVEPRFPSCPSGFQPLRFRFEVEDTGAGIPEDKIQEIFEPFQQVSELRFREEGTGLGLTISRRIARLMGGDIHVHSTPGAGSLFWFDACLPRKKDVKNVEQEHALQEIVGFTSSSINASNQGAPRILLADDNNDSRRVLQEFLLSLGFEVMEAADGQEVLAKSDIFGPDLILMDVRMPLIDGLEVTKRLRQMPHTHEMIVIGISASGVQNLEQQFLDVGGNDFLRKPIRFEHLLQKIKQSLGLEWVYATEQAFSEPQNSSTSMCVPSVEDLRLLMNAAKIGDIIAIRQWIKHHEQHEPEQFAFTRQIRTLAAQFQMNELSQFVEASLNTCQPSSSVNVSGADLVFPAKTELQELLRLADMHSVTGLRAYLSTLKEKDARYLPFIAQLHMRLDRFEFRNISEYLTQLLQQHGDSNDRP